MEESAAERILQGIAFTTYEICQVNIFLVNLKKEKL
jgi:hypothetical protein